jgi:RNA polymerase sigma-70 factor (ECF subfamily)
MSTEAERLSDVELVAAARGGDGDGFESLVKRYERPIFGYLFKMLRDREAALDVAQEVFIKVYNSLDRFSSEYRFSTWIYRIARNAAIDQIRRRGNHEESIETDDGEEAYSLRIESNGPSPQQSHEAQELRGLLDSVVNCLPAGYRELIVLRHAQDFSYEEIAEVTGLPLGTVKNRLFRAREMMRDMLVRRGFDEY